MAVVKFNYLKKINLTVESNKASMAVIKVPTNFNIDVEFEIPEFYRRLLALLMDILIEFFYYKIAMEIFRSIVRNASFRDVDELYDLQAIGMLFLLPILLYHIVMEITMNGQSLGKKIAGIRVVNENGGKASISQFLIRWLLRVSDVWIVMLILLLANNPDFGRNLEFTFIILAALGFLITDIALVVTSRKGQRIGDMLAHTILIRTNTQFSIEQTVFQEVADTYIPSFPQIMQLSDKDINAIKSILETARKKGDFHMVSAATEKIQSHLKIESALAPFDFLEVLLKDYNYLSIK
jgi:uncharacterized RDD family membrane protein YckC